MSWLDSPRASRGLVAALAVLATPGAASAAPALASAYTGSYTLVDLGPISGLPAAYGGLVFRSDDPSRLLIGGGADDPAGALYEVVLTRDAQNHVSGFTGVPAFLASAPYIDGGLAYGPGGVLFMSRWPSNELGQIKPLGTSPAKVVPLGARGVANSLAALAFVPTGFPGEGTLKTVSYPGGQWNTLTLTADATGTYDVATVTVGPTLGNGAEGVVHVPPGSPIFNTYSTILVTEYTTGTVASYQLDANGNPLTASRAVFVTGLTGALGATLDPLTGDFLFATFESGGRIIAVRGFASVPGPATSVKPLVVFGATATAGAPFNVTAVARDAVQLVDYNYTGTIHFTSNDPGATLPGDYTFTLQDRGIHAFPGGLTFARAGTSTVTVTDTVTASITGTTTLTVVHGPPDAARSTVAVTGTGHAPADGFSTVTLRVELKDAYGNPVNSAQTVVLAATAGTLQGTGASNWGGGVYVQTLRAPETAGSATITATVNGTALTGTATAVFDPDTTPPALSWWPSISATGGLQVSLHSSSPDLAGFRVFWGTQPGVYGAPLEFPASAAGTTVAIPGTAACTLFYVAATARDTRGNETAQPAPQQARTPDPGDPVAPTLLTATVGDQDVFLTWTGSVACDAYQYRIHRLDVGAGQERQLTSQGATGTSYHDNGAHGWGPPANGVLYRYRVETVDTEGRVSVADATVDATPAADVQPPEPVTGLTAVAGDTYADLAWTPSADPTLDHYQVYVSNTAYTTTTGLTPQVVPAASTSLRVAGLVDGVTYHVAVTAVDARGNERTDVSPVTVTPTDSHLPGALTGVAGTADIGSTVSVRWNVAGVQQEPDFGAYVIFFRAGTLGTVTDLTPVVVANRTAGNTQVTGLTEGTTYEFGVAIRDVSGNVGPLSRFSLTPQTPMDEIHPVLSTGGNGTTLSLEWAAWNPATQGRGVVAFYRVYRAAAAFTQLADATLAVTTSGGAGVRMATVTGVSAAAPTYLAVVPVSLQGWTPASVSAAAVVSGTPQDTAAPEDVTNLRATAVTETGMTVAWNGSANGTGDLAGYRVTVDGTTTDVGPTVTTVPLAGLVPGSAHEVTVSTFDGRSPANVGTGVTRTFHALASNPTDLALEPANRKLTLHWTVPPGGVVQSWRVYRSTTAFTSVAGLTPVSTAGSPGMALTGLDNGVDQWVAVTAVNRSGLENRDSVVVVTGRAEADHTGPVLADLRFKGVALSDGSALDSAGAFTATATDESGVAWIEFQLGATVAGRDTSAPFSVFADVSQQADGPSTVVVRTADPVGNLSEVTIPVVVALRAPAAPVITAPTPNQVFTGTGPITVVGSAEVGATVTILVNGAAAGSAAVAGGLFSVAGVVLREGTNSVRAAAENRGGSSPLSNPVSVTRDGEPPSTPRMLTAQAEAAGTVALQWREPATGELPATYRVYRAQSPITAPTPALRVGATSALTLRQLPPVDGTYFFAVTSVDANGNESAPTDSVSAASDRTLPRLATVRLLPQGPFDAAGGRLGRGDVRVSLIYSEPLSATPFVSFIVAGGSPISLPVTRVSDTEFSGFFVVGPGTSPGELLVNSSARDLVGNQGRDVDPQVPPFHYVTDPVGPALVSVTVDPPAPLKNDAQNPLAISVTVASDEAPDPNTLPELGWRLDNGPVTPLVLTRTAPAVFTASLTLQASAGANGAQRLSFAWNAVDDLGNASTVVTAPNSFEVFQGALPAADVPQGCAAASLAGGVVRVTWYAVEQAAAYRVFRKAPGATSATELPGELTTTSLEEDPGDDGTWEYSVASIRRTGSLESTSAACTPVAVESDSRPPPSPVSLALQLVGNGIYATWARRPTGETPHHFRFFRASTAITSLTGATVVHGNIPATSTEALDSQPSVTAHHYAVTAVDRAGNESGPSASAYLDFTLLPVAGLDVDVPEAGRPVVSWPAATGDTAGYAVYRTTPDGRAGLTTDMLTTTSFPDTTYASGDREYQVTKFNRDGLESPARRALLPDLELSIPANHNILRGQLNRIPATLTSRSSQSVTVSYVELSYLGRVHRSPAMVLSPGETENVDLLVGGEADLPDAVTYATRTVMEPVPGTRVVLHGSGALTAGSTSMGLEVFTEGMVRGGLGRVSFTVQNTSAEPVEVVTAAPGGQPSPEVIITVRDPDQNVLARVPYKRLLNGVLQVPSGAMVARVAPGGRFESGPVEVALPNVTAAEATVEVSIANFWARYGTAAPLRARGVTATVRTSLDELPYRAELTELGADDGNGGVLARTVFGVGEAVLIKGVALSNPAGVPVAYQPVRIWFSSRGVQRTVDAVSDLQGLFNVRFMTEATSAGAYSVWAGHPEMTERPQMGTFNVVHVNLAPALARVSLAKGQTYTNAFTARNVSQLPLHNVRLAAESLLDPLGNAVTGVTFDGGTAVAELGDTELRFPITISSTTQAPSRVNIRLVLTGDAGGTVRELARSVMEVSLADATASLSYAPTRVELGVRRDEQVTEYVRLTNNGYTPIENLRVELVAATGQPRHDWVTLASPGVLGPLAVGAQQNVGINFSPTTSSGLEDGIYETTLRVVGDNYPARTYQVVAVLTTTDRGAAEFHVVDVFTGTLIQGTTTLNNGVDNAEVRLSHSRLGNVTYTARTGADHQGIVYFGDVLAGTYNYRITASGHDTATGTLRVSPGVTATKSVWLETQVVSVSWSVTPTTIQDHYTVNIQQTFLTNVPAPVVVVEPGSFTLPADMRAGDVFTMEVAMTNHGLVRAERLALRVPPPDNYRLYELVGTLPEVLEARQQIRVAFKVTALRNFRDEVGAGAASCSSVPFGFGYAYLVCVDGDWQTKTGSASFVVSSGVCTSPPSTATPSATWSSGGSGGCSSGGCPDVGGFISPVTGLAVAGCPYETVESDGCTPSQSFVTANGIYSFDATDLPVEARGPDMSVTREYQAPNERLKWLWSDDIFPLGRNWHLPWASRLPAPNPPPAAGSPTYSYAPGEPVTLPPDAVDRITLRKYCLPIADRCKLMTGGGGGGGGGGGSGGGGAVAEGGLKPCKAEGMYQVTTVPVSSTSTSGTGEKVVMYTDGPTVRMFKADNSPVQRAVGGQQRMRMEPLTDGTRIVRDVSGNWKKYDAAGRMTQMGDRNNNILELDYDASARLVKVRNLASPGVFIELVYTGTSRVASSVRDNLGRSASYQYAGKFLAEVTNAAGEVSRYTNDQDYITEKVDGTGTARRISYDGGKPGISSRTVSGVNVVGAPGRLPLAQDFTACPAPDGGLRTAVTDGAGRYKERTYNPKGQLTHEYSSGGLERQLTREYFASGALKRSSERLRDGTTTSEDLDENGRPTAVTDPQRNTHQMTYSTEATHWSALKSLREPSGALYERTFDANGNVLTERMASGTAAETSARYEYNTQGEVIRLFRPASATLPTLELEYDARGRVTRLVETLEAGRTLETTFTQVDDATGADVTMTQGSLTWRVRLDAMGRVTQYRRPGDATPFGTLTYNANDLPLTTSILPDDPQNAWSVTRAYSLGKYLASISASSSAPATTTVTDDQGLPTEVTTSGGGLVAMSWDAYRRLTSMTLDGSTMTMTYNGQPRTGADTGPSTQLPATITLPWGGTVALKGDTNDVLSEMALGSARWSFSYLHNGLPSRVEMPGGRASTMAYDAVGRLRTQEYVRDAQTIRVMDLAYGPEGRLATVESGVKTVASYTYFQNGLLKGASLMGMPAVAYDYDAAGLLASATRADGSVVRFTHDLRGAISGVDVYADAAAVTPLASVTLTRDVRDRDTGGTSPGATVVMTHDAAGNVTGVTRSSGGRVLAMERTYDTAGRALASTMTQPGTAPVAAEYAAASGRVATLKLDTATVVTVVPGEFGSVDGFDANGVAVRFPRDTYGRPTGVTATRTADATAVFADQHTLNDEGQMASRTDSDRAESYERDAAGRLTRITATPGGDTTITYAGAFGDRSAVNGQAYAYNADGFLTGDGTRTFTYDGLGNVASIRGSVADLDLAYDALGRLQTVRRPDGTVIATYAYDAMGRRVSKTVGAQTTDFLYANDALLAERSPAGVLRQYVYLPGASGGTPVGFVEGSAFYAVVHDGAQRPRRVVDPAGRVVWKADFDVFGAATVDPDPDGDATPLEYNARLLGQYFDEETGFHYNTGRYYDPVTGRFLQMDPAGPLLGSEDHHTANDLYAYAFNDPTQYRDARGWWPSKGDAWGAAGAAQGYASLQGESYLGDSSSASAAMGVAGGAIAVGSAIQARQDSLNGIRDGIKDAKDAFQKMNQEIYNKDHKKAAEQVRRGNNAVNDMVKNRSNIRIQKWAFRFGWVQMATSALEFLPKCGPWQVMTQTIKTVVSGVAMGFALVGLTVLTGGIAPVMIAIASAGVAVATFGSEAKKSIDLAKGKGKKCCGNN